MLTCRGRFCRMVFDSEAAIYNTGWLVLWLMGLRENFSDVLCQVMYYVFLRANFPQIKLIWPSFLACQSSFFFF